jgi:cupin 2 domain-containing protein
MRIKNIFHDIPPDIPDEIIDKIISSDKIRVEKIVSKGHSTPADFWYDQYENEWVLVVKGKARLKFFDDADLVELKEGDYLNISAHTKHRVEWTDPETETIWLAVFY